MLCLAVNQLYLTHYPKITLMKKTCLLLCLATITSLSAISQDELKPFKFDLSLGYAIPGGTGAKGGVLFAAEPKYAVIPNLAVGLRMEVAAVARGTSNQDDSYSEFEVKASASYLLTGDFYFTDNYSFRPFAGAGGGIYTLAGATVNEYDEEVNTGNATTKFGGLVRAGFEARHFRFGIEYNFVPDSKFEDQYGNENNITTKNGYLGIKVGICIGGGPR